ncbi:MAG TPA: glycosyltransferase [Armatimonadota bacterium]|nr:glycosyltransferase [Armatimonadota bacterium]
MTTLTAISVAIPTYNRLDILRETVRRVLAERCQAGDVEVIVIDDQSDDGTWEWLEAESRLHEGLAAIRNPSKGRSSARNAGINAARGAIVCLLDDDMWVTPGFADAHWAAHDGCESPWAVMGRMLPSDENDSQLATVCYDERLRRIDSEMASYGEELPCNYLCTGNVSLPRSVFEGGVRFDEGFTGYSYEDTELGYRLEAMGVRLVRAERALAYHRTDASIQGLLRKQAKAGRSAVRLLRLHPDAAAKLDIPYEITGVNETARRDAMPKAIAKALFFAWPAKLALDAGLHTCAALGLTKPALRFLYLAGYHRYGRAYREAAREVA